MLMGSPLAAEHGPSTARRPAGAGDAPAFGAGGAPDFGAAGARAPVTGGVADGAGEPAAGSTGAAIVAKPWSGARSVATGALSSLGLVAKNIATAKPRVFGL